MRKTALMLLLPLMVCLMMLSCKPQVPGKYLQPGEMEDILYDYHIAMGMIGDNDSNDYQKRMYEASVLRKHGVTEAEFDSSLVYYTRHSDRFKDIYENLSKRLSDEAVALGASVSDVGNFGENASSGDTTNVWKMSSSCVLATQVPYNVESFVVKADSAYRRGDKMILSFDAQFIFQDGYKDGVAMLAVRFANDSVAVRTVHMSESAHFDIAIADERALGIKEIRGFFSLQDSQNSTATTLKLMFLSNIRLVRCHVNGPLVPKDSSAEDQPVGQGSDSVQQQSVVVGTEQKPMQSLGGM